MHRPSHWLNGWLRPALFPWLLLGLPLDHPQGRGSDQDSVHLRSPTILTALMPGENLLLYITTTTHVISTTIMVECPEEGHAFGVQRLMYFVSEVLSESKVRYPSIQKLFSLYSSLRGSFITISMNTRSRLSLISHWRIYSTIGTPLDASPRGQWNWRLSAWISSRTPLSSHNH
jgi:hypothetical protein